MENNFNENPVVAEKAEVVADNQKKSNSSSIDGIADKAKAFVEKIVAGFKKDPKKYGIFAAAAVLALILVITSVSIIFSVATNNYKTPVKTMEKYANQKRFYTPYEYQADLLNGFTESDFEDVYKILLKSDDIKDSLEDSKEYFNDSIDDRKDEYGKNYKVKYKITSKSALDKDDLKDFREELRDAADDLDAELDEIDDFDSDDWDDLVDESGLRKSQLKKMFKAMKKIEKKWSSAKVTKGYELEVTVITTGRELDEPIENEITIYVYKVGGRWISSGAISSIF